MHQILHVVVVGFHHKRGCQVEFCYPPLKPEGGDGDSQVPEQWANLPSLALPDGAHNVQQDTIYFMLPSLDDPTRAVFGISCYRQIATKDLIARDDDVTRSTVQKSVCVLSRVPLYGVLKAKLQLITQAYFNERDFAKVEVLSQMYTNLCDMFEGDLVDGQAASMDIPATDLVKRFKHRLIMLFKLVLLEKKVVFNIFPVELLGDTLIGLISLFPLLLEEGLFYGAVPTTPLEAPASSRSTKTSPQTPKRHKKSSSDAKDNGNDASSEQAVEAVEETSKKLEDDLPDLLKGAHPKKDGFGFPLSIFCHEALFSPYLSISFLDVVRSPGVRSYVIGATNALFVQRRELVDAVITIDEASEGVLEISSPELKKALQPTTADLRFMDYVIKNVEGAVDPAAWEGGDEWLRLQFRAYLLSLAATSKSDLTASLADFGAAFVDEWRRTRNYRTWMAGYHEELLGAAPGHAFAGGLGVSDVLLRVEHTVGGSEHGRKMINAVSNTGRLVSETGSKFRHSITNWFKGTSPTTSNPPSTTPSASSSSANLQAADQS